MLVPVIIQKLFFFLQSFLIYCILLSKLRTFFTQNDDEILPEHYTWKVVEKGLEIKWGIGVEKD
jgi:hypothetical protein